MKRHVLLYGSVLAFLAIGIQWMQYRFIILDYAVELYGTGLAMLFTVVGIWAGRKLTDEKVIREEVIVEKQVFITSPVPAVTNFEGPDPDDLGISKREFEVLGLMAEGYSNQEIAEKTFLSINTVKTHISNLFVKLDVKRRTQAISRAKELNLLQ
jgi:DNA-binding CsgD family transcriptional regulator